MLRVGLTGELGSGKSTVGRLLAERGAIVLSSDEMARAMMQPGEPVYRAIVEQFGTAIVQTDGSLDRKALAALAFQPGHPRIDELNAIVHPPVLAEQEREIAKIAQAHPDAIVVIESALIFSTKHAGGDRPWSQRFDRIVLVTAPDAVKIERFLHRMAAGRTLSAHEQQRLRADAKQRLWAQRISSDVIAACIVIENTGDLATLTRRTEEVFQTLRSYAEDDEARATRS